MCSLCRFPSVFTMPLPVLTPMDSQHQLATFRTAKRPRLFILIVCHLSMLSVFRFPFASYSNGFSMVSALPFALCLPHQLQAHLCVTRCNVHAMRLLCIASGVPAPLHRSVPMGRSLRSLGHARRTPSECTTVGLVPAMPIT